MEHYRNLLDTEATANKKMVPEFRERDVTKEIQPKMRFTASTQLERIIDAIHRDRNSLDSRKTGDPRKQSISDIVLDTVKQNLIGSHLKHKEARARQSLSSEPTKESSAASVKGSLAQDSKLKTFYSTTSSSRLRVVASHFMTQNHFLAREINKNYKKLHFKAA